MHNVQFVIYIAFNMFTKAQTLQIQDGYRRVQSNFHIHISVRKLRIMQILERNKLQMTLKCYNHTFTNF
jgi:CDP-diacylglycerol pyrophosphatase